MTRGAETEATRLRRCRELFERAVRLGCTPAQVRRAEAEDRWRKADARLAVKREEQGRALAWWQR